MARATGEGLSAGQLGQPVTFRLDAVGLMGEPQVSRSLTQENGTVSPLTNTGNGTVSPLTNTGKRHGLATH